MAAPASKSIKNLNGIWTLNKQESDDTDTILQLQGVGWIIRKAISMMTVTLHIRQFVDSDGLEHIDIEQPGAAGIKGTSEKRNLNGEWKDHEDHVFGAVKGRTKWIKLSELKDDGGDEAFLKKYWDDSEKDGEFVDSYVESQGNGWTAHQVWGFSEVQSGGQKMRKYIRYVVVRKKDEVRRARLIYDFKDELN